MRRLRWVSFWVTSTLVVAATGPVLAKDEPVKPEMPYETASRLLDRPGQAEGELNDHDPDATTEALRALFAVSNAELPARSSCQGHYGPQKATVKDMLAMWMSNLNHGKNVIKGNCQSGQCAVRIAHSAEEDVFSATIVFNKIRGKASVPTMQCVMTP
ncbi:MAG: hypothetical protein LBE81_13370 [Azonexus sp.]|jgi:hypothetical protein|uniref:hypothetical protein n=1 Tax=Azonexus sp. TaxID=1872668 RepID=UPI0028183E68|nr:hypothetical protein [Azonexus sp.]MDR0777607.1 hypothetical protein [Azonexus sp.]